MKKKIAAAVSLSFFWVNAAFSFGWEDVTKYASDTWDSVTAYVMSWFESEPEPPSDNLAGKWNKLTGELSGTPTKAGTYTFSVKAKNKGGMDIVEYTMTVAEDTGTKASSSAVSAGVRDEANTPAILELENTGLAFRIDNEDATLSNVRVFVNDELVEGVAVASDGTFTLPAEYADREASVYAAGLIDGAEFETTEVDVAAESESHESGCNAGMSGMMLLLCGAVILKKK